MKKIIVLFVAFIFLSLLNPVLADDEYRRLDVDLKAKGFTQPTYVDELKSTDIIFGPKDQFQLQLRIINAGNRNQTNIKVRQILPIFVTANSDREFIIPQIAAGQDYIKNITVTVKDKSNIYSKITWSQITVNATSEIGTVGQDSLAFYTANGTYGNKVTTSTATVLPNTGASPIIFGTLIGVSLFGISLALRRAARGY
jgi:LPXTG-motif cell wall-anchored protein